MEYIERIFNAKLNEIIERAYTQDEMNEILAERAKATEQAEIETLKATAKAELLAKLGITEDEAKLLLS